MSPLRARPALIAYVIMLVFMGVGLVLIRNVADEAQRRTCRSSLEERVVLRDFLTYARQRSPSEQGRAFLRFFDERLRIPPAVCAGTGIDTDSELERIRRGRPPLPAPEPPTTIVGEPGPQGPPGPPGPAGPPGPRGGAGSSPPAPSTTMRPPPPSSSTSTSRPGPLPTLPPFLQRRPDRAGYAGGMIGGVLLVAAVLTIRGAAKRRP